MNTSEKLDAMAELQAKKDVLNFDRAQELAQIITPELQARIDAINHEYDESVSVVDSNLSNLKAEVRAEVLQAGKTVRGQWFMAVYVKGQAGGWDSAKLEGYALAHPEILVAKKPNGEPSVTFRVVGK